MSALKIPSQFPVIVGVVVVVHAVLAIILFSGSPEGKFDQKASTRKASEAEISVPASSAGTIASNPLMPRAGTLAKDENGELTSRFPSRVPTQSELNGDVPAVAPETVATGGQAEAEVEAEAPAVAAVDEEAPAETKTQERISNPGSFSLADLPSAVAAAKAAPVSAKKDLGAEAKPAEDDSKVINRLRMVEAEAPRPVPVSQPRIERREPVSVEVEKKATPSPEKKGPELTSIKPVRVEKEESAPPVVAIPLKQIRAIPVAQTVDDSDADTAAAPRPGPSNVDPITPDGSRRFRVVKPIER